MQPVQGSSYLLKRAGPSRASVDVFSLPVKLQTDAGHSFAEVIVGSRATLAAQTLCIEALGSALPRAWKGLRF